MDAHEDAEAGDEEADEGGGGVDPDLFGAGDAEGGEEGGDHAGALVFCDAIGGAGGFRGWFFLLSWLLGGLAEAFGLCIDGSVDGGFAGWLGWGGGGGCGWEGGGVDWGGGGGGAVVVVGWGFVLLVAWKWVFNGLGWVDGRSPEVELPIIESSALAVVEVVAGDELPLAETILTPIEMLVLVLNSTRRVSLPMNNGHKSPLLVSSPRRIPGSSSSNL